MTVATINTVMDHTSDAGFQAWYNEFIAFLFGVGANQLGVTQTADTGQIGATALRPVVNNTAAGYVIGRFNDTAQATTPIFFKLEFGTGNGATIPALWITIGTGSNGTGTLTGTVGTRVATNANTAPSSTITPYITCGCYNTAAGVLWVTWKINGANTPTTGLGGFFIFRSADNTGAVTTDSFMLLTNAVGVNGSTNNGTYQVISHLTNIAYAALAPFTSASAFCFMPFSVSSTLSGGNAQTGLCFQYTPLLGITPWIAMALQSEWAMNSTNTETIVGAAPHTYRMVGGPCGCTIFSFGSYSSATYGIVALWE